MNRGAVAEINLSAIAHNLQSVRKIVKNRPVIAVVKADAYGHGAMEVSKKLFKENISFIAVAFTGEAIELREAGIKAPIIVLFDTGEIKDFFDFKLIPVIYNVDTALSFSAEAKKRNTIIKVHVKIDTGMGRMGLNGNYIARDLIKISEMDGIELTGLLSHFSEADLSDRSYAVLQLNRFNKIRETISGKLKRKFFSHIANSAAVLTFEDAHLDAVRPGLMLYGYSPINQKSEVSPPTHPSPSRGEGKGGGESQTFGLWNSGFIKYFMLDNKNNFTIDPDEFIAAMRDRSQNTEYRTQNTAPPPPYPLPQGAGDTPNISSPLRGEGKGGGEVLCSVDMAFLCNPNNPTGRLIRKEGVKRIAAAAKEFKCYLIVDEAFIDFCAEDSIIKDMEDNPSLIVLRSMTGFYALSGLRIGYGVFPQHLIGSLKRYKEPWTVNNLAQRAAVVALKDKIYRSETFRLLKEEKRFLEKSFKKIGIEFFDSDVNFYLLKISSANEIFQQLKRKGILVRDCSNFRGLDNTYLRVAVKSHKENTILIKELTSIL